MSTQASPGIAAALVDRRAVPLANLPNEVTIYEVSPRDGLQNETVVVPTATKLELISRLVGAGLKAIEVTSLVRARVGPAARRRRRAPRAPAALGGHPPRGARPQLAWARAGPRRRCG